MPKIDPTPQPQEHQAPKFSFEQLTQLLEQMWNANNKDGKFQWGQGSDPYRGESGRPGENGEPPVIGGQEPPGWSGWSGGVNENGTPLGLQAPLDWAKRMGRLLDELKTGRTQGGDPSHPMPTSPEVHPAADAVNHAVVDALSRVLWPHFMGGHPYPVQGGPYLQLASQKTTVGSFTPAEAGPVDPLPKNHVITDDEWAATRATPPKYTDGRTYEADGHETDRYLSDRQARIDATKGRTVDSGDNIGQYYEDLDLSRRRQEWARREAQTQATYARDANGQVIYDDKGVPAIAQVPADKLVPGAPRTYESGGALPDQRNNKLRGEGGAALME